MEYFVVGIIVAFALLATLTRLRNWLDPDKKGGGCGCDCDCSEGCGPDEMEKTCCSSALEGPGPCADCHCSSTEAASAPGETV